MCKLLPSYDQNLYLMGAVRLILVYYYNTLFFVSNCRIIFNLKYYLLYYIKPLLNPEYGDMYIYMCVYKFLKLHGFEMNDFLHLWKGLYLNKG